VVDWQVGGLMMLPTGVDVHCQRLSDWRLTEMNGEEQPASTAHMGHEFKKRKRKVTTRLSLSEKAD